MFETTTEMIQAQFFYSGLRPKNKEEIFTRIQELINKEHVTLNVKELTGLYNINLPVFQTELHLGDIIGKGWGKGINRDQAFFSGVFEAIERCSWGYYDTHHPETITASYKELKEKECVIDIPRYLGKPLAEKMTFVSPFQEDIPIKWMAGWSLIHNRKTYVPLCFAFYTDEEKDFYLSATGGLSSGIQISDAILQGLMEIVEHDAYIMSSRSKLVSPQIDLTTITLPEACAIINEITAQQGEMYIYYITNDVGIHAFRAILRFPAHDWLYFSPGLGVNLNPDIALMRSLTECVQGYISTMHGYHSTPMRAKHQFLINSGFSILNAQNFKFWVEPGHNKLDYNSLKNESTQSIPMDLKKASRQILNAVPDTDIIYLDLTNKTLGIPVVKVLVPGLQQATQIPFNFVDRMFTVPQQMQATQAATVPADFYLGMLPH